MAQRRKFVVPVVKMDPAISRAIESWQLPSRRLFVDVPSIQAQPQLDLLGKQLKKLDTTRQLSEAMQKLVSPPRAASLIQSLGAHQALRTRLVAHPSPDLANLSHRIAAMTRGVDVLKREHKKWSSIVRATDAWKPIFQKTATAIDSFVRAQQEIDEQSDLFVVNHAWPLPTSLPSRAFHAVVSYASAPKREVTKLMRDMFRPGRRNYRAVESQLLDSPYFVPRRPLLKQALRALRREEWYLVISALLPLVEGVLVDFAFAGGEPPSEKRPRRAVHKIKEEDAEGPIRAIETMLFGAGAGTAIFSGYDPKQYGVPGEPKALNRNAIFHGSARRYGTGENALKLFLLLVVMAECFDFSEAEPAS